jgi:hypothetical protein
MPINVVTREIFGVGAGRWEGIVIIVSIIVIIIIMFDIRSGAWRGGRKELRVLILVRFT